MTEREADPSISAHVVRFWRELDASFQRVETTWWGAVVTDARFPSISDANYARVDLASGSVGVHDIDLVLVPALTVAGVTSTYHVVIFHPEANRTLLTELSARGHRLTWDLVMEHDPDAQASGPAPLTESVEELDDSDEVWGRVRESMALFGIERDDAVEQLCAIERAVLRPGGKRWFGLRDVSGALESLGALTVLDGVGYIDNVATFPRVRGRGFASAVAAHITALARIEGAEHVCLFADPDADATVRMYERLGFRPAGHLAAARGLIPPDITEGSGGLKGAEDTARW